MLRKVIKKTSSSENDANNDNNVNVEEQQYLDLIRDILAEGTLEHGRTEIPSAFLEQRCIFHWNMLPFQSLRQSASPGKRA